MSSVQRCNRCVMDNKSDETITFDKNGHCNYCTTALEQYNSIYFPNEEGEKRLKLLIKRLKEENKNNEYDCIMGLSGGLDSSYLAYLGYKWGLRILAIHVDDGFDTKVSKDNLKKLCEKANIKMITIKPDAEQLNDLTKAYMRAGVPNLAVMQDNITLAILFEYAKRTKIRTFLSGGNFALECILQKGNSYSNGDVTNIIDIHNKFGVKPINKLMFISEFKKIAYQKLLKIEYLRPLNLIDYNKIKAMKELQDFCDFSYYGSKHHENLFTKFLQIYWMPNKFNVDKRTSHLSSLIITGQMTRDQALAELEKPLYEDNEMQKEIDIILNILDMSREEFEDIMKQSTHQHTEYKTSAFENLRRIKNILK